MRKIQKKNANNRPRSRAAGGDGSPVDFDEVLGLIEAARTRAYAAVNTTLIELYWSVGEYISRKTAENAWGDGTVKVLSETIQRRFPGMTGFSSSNLWRMSQFFEAYRGKRKLAPLVRELSWTHNLLLFFNRSLNCLVAFELKIDEFQPSHLGQLEFYLEALDRDVKKPHERPSIGVLLCATKDSEVVEYALSRAMSPALVAEYQTRLPDKSLLQAKLHEFYELAKDQVAPRSIEGRKAEPRRKKKTIRQNRKP